MPRDRQAPAASHRRHRLLSLIHISDRLKEAVERLKNEAAEKDARIGALTRELLNLKVKQYEAGQKLLFVFETGMTALQIRQFCDRLLEGGKAETAAVFSEDAKGGFNYCAGKMCIRDRSLAE